MNNDFFNDHPMLGSVFDFNRDGSMSLGEAGAMGAVGAMFASEAMRASGEAEREAGKSPWDDNDDDDYDLNGSRGNEEEEVERDSVYDYEEVDTTSRKSVMKAINDDDYDGDIESLVEEALDNGVRFKPKNIIELSYLIWDQDLLVRLISTSKPRFLQEHADELSSRWGPVELEYHVDAFDEEYSEGNTYYVNTPEEDW